MRVSFSIMPLSHIAPLRSYIKSYLYAHKCTKINKQDFHNQVLGPTPRFATHMTPHKCTKIRTVFINHRYNNQQVIFHLSYVGPNDEKRTNPSIHEHICLRCLGTKASSMIIYIHLWKGFIYANKTLLFINYNIPICYQCQMPIKSHTYTDIHPI